jgi:hypothetical protein
LTPTPEQFICWLERKASREYILMDTEVSNILIREKEAKGTETIPDSEQ